LNFVINNILRDICSEISWLIMKVQMDYEEHHLHMALPLGRNHHKGSSQEVGMITSPRLIKVQVGNAVLYVQAPSPKTQFQTNLLSDNMHCTSAPDPEEPPIIHTKA
jgi:hypothetical protein